MDREILSTADLAERWGCGISSISARWRSGKMPAPFNADQQRCFRWHRTVIDAYERGEWTPERVTDVASRCQTR